MNLQCEGPIRTIYLALIYPRTHLRNFLSTEVVSLISRTVAAFAAFAGETRTRTGTHCEAAWTATYDGHYTRCIGTRHAVDSTAFVVRS